MNQSTQAAEANPEVTYYTAEHGVRVRVMDTTEEGVLLENLDTGGTSRVQPGYLLLEDEPEQKDLITRIPDHTKVIEKPKAEKKPQKRLGRVTALTTNIQGGVRVEFPGRLVLLQGSNGSSKTTIVRAMELAGTAKASDVAGRGITSRESMLIPLIDPAVDHAIMSAMKVHLPATDTEVECVYNAKVKDATHASKAEHTTAGIKVVFPLRGVHDHLRGSAEKAQAWLLQTACGDLDRPTALARLPDKAATLFPILASKGTSIVDALLSAVSDAPSRASSARRKSEAALQEADRLAQGLAPPASEEQIEGLRAATEEAENILTHAIAVEAATKTLVTVQQGDLNAWQLRMNAISAEVSQRVDPLLTGALAKLAALQPDPHLADKQATRAAGVRLMQTSLQGASENCMVCASPLPRVAQEAILAGLQGQVGAALAADRERQGQFNLCAQTVNKLRAERASLEAEYARLGRQVLSAQQPQPEVEQVLDESMTPTISVIDARATLNITRQNLNAAIERTSAWKRSRTARGDAEKHAQDQRTYEALTKDLQATVTWAVDEAADTFAARVQSLLPDDDVFWLDPRTGGYGLVKTITDDEGRPIRHRRDSALCGAEWARVTLALAGASTPADADLAILVPEDRAWDAKTLRKAMEGLVKFPGMVVITSTIKPFRGIPKGWHLIETDEL